MAFHRMLFAHQQVSSELAIFTITSTTPSVNASNVNYSLGQTRSTFLGGTLFSDKALSDRRLFTISDLDADMCGTLLTRPGGTILPNGRYVALCRISVYIEVNLAAEIITPRVGIARTPVRRALSTIASVYNHHLDSRPARRAIVVGIDTSGHQLVADAAARTTTRLPCRVQHPAKKLLVDCSRVDALPNAKGFTCILFTISLISSIPTVTGK